MDTLITSITLVVGFHGEAISSGDELENFSASSFVLKHLNLAPENFFTVCNASFLSVKTKVWSVIYKTGVVNIYVTNKKQYRYHDCATMINNSLL